MQLTTNLSLKKPDYSDPVDIKDINDNMDTIDTQLSLKADKTQILTNVPAGAKFTDTNTTYDEITEAEITSGDGTSSRAISGRRIGFLKAWVQGLISALTKADIGLGNVSNINQMPANGGTFSGMAKAHSNTSYTVPQLRNVILSPDNANASSMQDGEIWIKYV